MYKGFIGHWGRRREGESRCRFDTHGGSGKTGTGRKNLRSMVSSHAKSSLGV